MTFPLKLTPAAPYLVSQEHPKYWPHQGLTQPPSFTSHLLDKEGSAPSIFPGPQVALKYDDCYRGLAPFPPDGVETRGINQPLLMRQPI